MTHNLTMTFTVADRSREEVFAAILDVSCLVGTDRRQHGPVG
ncbi:hypothetical protein AB0I34_30470 [Kribbella sp. NPDC050281]